MTLRAFLVLPLIAAFSSADPFTMPNGAKRELSAPPGHLFSLRNATFSASVTLQQGEPIVSTSTSSKAGTLPIKITREACVDLQVHVTDSNGIPRRTPECSPTITYVYYIVHLIDPGQPHDEGGSLTKKFNYHLPAGTYSMTVTRRTLVAGDRGSITSAPVTFTIP